MEEIAHKKYRLDNNICYLKNPKHTKQILYKIFFFLKVRINSLPRQCFFDELAGEP